MLLYLRQKDIANFITVTNPLFKVDPQLFPEEMPINQTGVRHSTAERFCVERVQGHMIAPSDTNEFEFLYS